jgi:hypothetical protein
VKEFFDELIDQSPVVFTVLGSKPVSAITIDVSTQEEMLLQNQKLIEALPSKRKYKALRDIHDYYSQGNLLSHWEKWMELKKDRECQNYLFRLQPTYSPMYVDGLIANSAEVIRVLIEHYEIFSKELALQFDPIKVVLEFEDGDSSFWNTVFQSHYLQGILFGYGVANAYLFSEYIEKSEQQEFSLRSFRFNARKKYGISLPRFRSYFIDDPVVEKYRLEREQIAARLKENTFAPYLFGLLYGSKSSG